MKKTYYVALALISGNIAAQTTGKVGINTDAPAATLDIKPNTVNAAESATTNEGVLIPRLSKARVLAIASANRVEGTLVYVKDAVATTDNANFTGTGKGFYHWDSMASRWTKINQPAENIYVTDGVLTGDRVGSTNNFSYAWHTGTSTADLFPIFFGQKAGSVRYLSTTDISDLMIRLTALDASGAQVPGVMQSMNVINNGLSQLQVVNNPSPSSAAAPATVVSVNARVGVAEMLASNSTNGANNSLTVTPIGTTNSSNFTTQSAVFKKVRTVSGSQTVNATDHYLIVGNSDGATITLPAANTNNGREICIKRNGGTTLTVLNVSPLPNSQDTLVPYEAACYISNGTSWFKF